MPTVRYLIVIFRSLLCEDQIADRGHSMHWHMQIAEKKWLKLVSTQSITQTPKGFDGQIYLYFRNHVKTIMHVFFFSVWVKDRLLQVVSFHDVDFNL